MNRRAIISGAILIALVIVFALFGWQQWQRARSAATETRLATGQRGAAIESGSDAVQTIGNTMAEETAIHDVVKEGTDAIQSAPAGDSNDAADRAACRMRSYRHSSKCVALLGPIAD